MEITATTEAPEANEADTVVLGVFAGEEGAAEAPAEVAEMLASGEARATGSALAVGHSAGKRWIVVGLGPRSQFTPERARSAAAATRGRAREITTKSLCWRLPAGTDEAIAEALVEGTVLADYSFRRFKSVAPEEDEAPVEGLDELLVSAPSDLGEAVGDAARVAAAVNSARDLQNRPGNDLTPTALADHARALAQEIDALEVEA